MSLLRKAVFNHCLPVCWEELPSHFGRPADHGGQHPPICCFKLMTASWCSRQLPTLLQSEGKDQAKHPKFTSLKH